LGALLCLYLAPCVPGMFSFFFFFFSGFFCFFFFFFFQKLLESPFAIHHVCRTLRTLFTERWPTFPYNVKVQTMMYLVQYLGTKGLSLPAYVTLELCLVIVRITKMGWFEGSEMKVRSHIFFFCFLKNPSGSCFAKLQVYEQCYTCSTRPSLVDFVGD
jgi:hypothetical protein